MPGRSWKRLSARVYKLRQFGSEREDRRLDSYESTIQTHTRAFMSIGEWACGNRALVYVT